jgi:nucleotide-binding universal stress UspA family protein
MTSPSPTESSQPTGPIVVGVDGSPSSLDALAWAVGEAHRGGVPVVAVAVWCLPTNYGWNVEWVGAIDFEGEARHALEQNVAKVVGAVGDPVVTLKVVNGHPSPVLVEESHHASLVVVGTRGHGEFAGFLLGSVSSFVATHAACPVVIVRDGLGRA